MNLEEFRKLFARAPEKFPVGLETRYPRLLQQMLAKWDSPKELEAYLNELVVDQRGDRQGFPQEILREILFISTLFERWRAERKRKASPEILLAIGSTLVETLEKSQLTLTPALLGAMQAMTMKIMRDDATGMGDVTSMVNQKDRDGMTLLMQAASVGAEKCLIHLLKNGANPHMSDNGGNRAIHWAVTMGRLRATEILLFFGADPNARNVGGVPPMALAAIKPDPAIASRLIDYGVDPNAPDAKGDFPLHRAVSARATETVRFLLSAGASKDMKNREGKTPADLVGANEVMSRVFEQHQANLIRGAMQK